MLTLFVKTCPTKVHPVSVGNMKRLLELLAGTTFHPRIRGEYICPKKTDAPSIGSPPHPRGILRYSQGERSMARFTPASAGNMINVDIPVSSTQVHPRIRGEYSGTGIVRSRNSGSPPHPRGIWCGTDFVELVARFTPASAGNIENDHSF